MTTHADEQAELATLGAMVLDAAEGRRVLHEVQAEDFAFEQHRQTFRVLDRMLQDEVPVDAGLLRAALDARKVFGDVSSAGFIDRVTASCPVAGNGVQYARIVREHALARTAAKAAQDYARVCGNGKADLGFAALVQAHTALRTFRDPPAVLLPPEKDLMDVLEGPEPPPPAMLVERLFTRPGVHVVFGPPQAGKSWAVMQLAVDLVTGGGDFLQVQELAIVPRGTSSPERVLWIYGSEDTERRITLRLRKLCRGREPPERGAFFFASPDPELRFNSPEGLAWVRARARATGATVLVLDTVASLTGDTLDASKAEQVGPFLKALHALRDDLDLSIFLLHHTRKGGQDIRNQGGKADAMLGAQTWRSLSDSVLMLDCADGNTEDVTVRSIKAKDIDRPLPPVRVTLDMDTARFRPLCQDEQPPEREKAGTPGRSVGRPSRCTLEAILALRDKHPGGITWKDMRHLLKTSEGAWKNNSVRLQGELLDQGHVVVLGVLKWGDS